MGWATRQRIPGSRLAIFPAVRPATIASPFARTPALLLAISMLGGRSLRGAHTLTLVVTSKPSIWLSSSRRIRCTSRSAPVCASKRFVASSTRGARGAANEGKRRRRGHEQHAATQQASGLLPQVVPPVGSRVLCEPMASISSMNTMAGEFSRARRNTSRTMRGPSPRYF